MGPAPLELGLGCCSAEMASRCCSPQVSTSFQDRRERKAMLEPQGPQVGHPSLQAEVGRGWLLPTPALLSLSTGHFPYDLSHFGANLRVSPLPAGSGSQRQHPARFGVPVCALAAHSKMYHPAG